MCVSVCLQAKLVARIYIGCFVATSNNIMLVDYFNKTVDLSVAIRICVNIVTVAIYV